MSSIDRLQVNSVSVMYPVKANGGPAKELLAVKNVSFGLAAGEVLALIGPNGAGKTSLVRAVSGVLPLQTGQVLLEGQDLARFSTVERARRLAVVPQARNLPPAFTAWETVLLGRTPYLNWLGQTSARDEELTRQAMEQTRTLELAHRRVGELSGGEQQRLLLARALAQSPRLLIMDEPTTHLDLKYQVNLLDQVRSLAHQSGLAVLLVLHDLNLVAHYADQVALMVAGELRALGAPDEVLTADLLSQAYHLPLQVLPAGASGGRVILPWG